MLDAYADERVSQISVCVCISSHHLEDVPKLPRSCRRGLGLEPENHFSRRKGTISMSSTQVMEGNALFDGILDVTERICRIGDIPDVGPDQVMYEAGFSSIDALDLLVDLEDAYRVSISDEDFMQAQTPRALYTLISRLRKEQ